LGPE